MALSGMFWHRGSLNVLAVTLCDFSVIGSNALLGFVCVWIGMSFGLLRRA
jgi:hypothetical protein